MDNNWPIIFWLAVIANVVISFAVANAAQKKGRSWGAFFALSLFVSWLIMAIIVAAIAPISSTSNPAKEKPNVSGATEKCRSCAFDNKSGELNCAVCGSSLVS